MTHGTPEYPAFTDWIVKNCHLSEPFRLIDVGVQGGIHPRWRWLGDYFELWAFDPLADAIETLSSQNPAPNRLHYFQMGLGSEDGERPFQRCDNPFGSAFLPTSYDETTIPRTATGDWPVQWRRVKISRLDTLMAQGLFSIIDAMKLDCEGFEIEVLKGAGRFFMTSGVFSVESESSLKLHKWYDPCHFVEIYKLLGPRGFDVYDLYYYRNTRPEIPDGYPLRGQPDTFDFLFLRGFGVDDDLSRCSGDRLIKMAITAELYKLQDVAANILSRARDQLSTRFSIDEAIELLRLSWK